MSAPQPKPVGAESNEMMTNEVYYTNEPDGQGGFVKVRKKRWMKKDPEKIIQQVRRQVSMDAAKGNAVKPPESIKLEGELENFIKIKLVEWDKDASGSFSPDEVVVAMEELRDMQEKHAHLKWNILICLVLLLLFLGTSIGAVAIVMAVTTDVEVAGDGQMRAPIKDSDKSGAGKLQTAIIQTTQSSEVSGLLDILNFDTTTDQWMMADDALREIDQVSFTTSNGQFHNYNIAEMTRTDAGPTGTNDKLNILTTSGTQLRVWESLGELEVKWPGSNMWEVQVQSSRLLQEADGDMAAGDTEDDDSPPRRLFGKGGVVVYHGGHRGYGTGGGGGGSGCPSKRCSVPYGTTQSCRNWCQYGQCYDHSTGGTLTTYKCTDGGARGMLTPFTRLMWQGLTALMLFRACSE